MELLGFVNMNKTERITYAFNMRAPGGRYYTWSFHMKIIKLTEGLFDKFHEMTSHVISSKLMQTNAHTEPVQSDQ